ncbi:MAG: hypothetical protein QM804_12175 [Propionicimonas sp.]
MIFDQPTMSLATAVVMITTGMLYVMETLARPSSAAVRLWTIAFLAGTMTTFSYLVWALELPGAWIATAVGNACFVLAVGCLWLGCRSFNDHHGWLPGALVAAVALAELVAVLLAGPQGGDWAGASIMFAGIAGFAGLGAVESRRGILSRQSLVVAISVVLGATALYYVGRLVTLLVLGTDSPEFRTWFGSVNTSILTMVFAVTTVTSMSVLRATESTLRGRGRANSLEITTDGLLDPRSFEAMLASVLERCERSGESLAVIALRMEELPRIATAFGAQEKAVLVNSWRSSVRATAPVLALVGEEGPAGLMVALPIAAGSEARTLAMVLHQRVLDGLAATGVPVTPVLGVGIATTDVFGYREASLIEASNAAARRSAETPDSPPVVATELPVSRP